MSFQLALFDWNGTLFNDLEVTYATTVHLFTQLAPGAIIPTIDEYRSEFDPGAMFECYYSRGVPRTVPQTEMYKLWSAHYESICTTAQLADGSIKTLTFLRQCGIPIILVSAAPRETRQHLGRLKIAHFFDRMCFEVADKAATIRRMLDRERVPGHDAFYVGDSVGDIIHGKDAGVVTFGYAKGCSSKDRLRTAGPHYVVDSLLDVLSVVRAQIPN